MKLNKYNDPGHGWLRVPRSLLTKLGIQDKITISSYMKGDYVYLEEDQDLSTFINTMEKAGKTVKYNDSHTNKQSKIRQYTCYKNYSKEEWEEIINLRKKLLTSGIHWSKPAKTKIKTSFIDDLKHWKDHYNI